MRKHISISISVITAVILIGTTAFAAKQPQVSTFEAIMSHYEAIRISLVNDTTTDVERHAKEIARLAEDATRTFDAAAAGIDASKKGECTALLPVISREAKAIANANDLDSARDAFFELSKSLVKLKAMASGDDRPTTYYCSMAKRSWLQTADEVGNPYYGPKMAKCGQKVED